MPYMLNPANYTQTMRPNLYNMAYRRIGAYKGMGRLHPSNYLEIGGRPNRIGGTTGQYSTLSGQLALLPPSLRGLGNAIPVWNFRQKRWVRAPGGLGDNTITVTGPPAGGYPTVTSTTSLDQILSLPTQSIFNTPNAPNEYTLMNVPQSVNPNTGQTNWSTPTTDPITSDPNFPLYVAGGFLLLLLLGGRR